MKITKRYYFAMVLAALLVSSGLNAQGGRGPGGPGRTPMTEEDIKERVDQLAETLKLSEEQHKLLEKSELDWYKKMDVERQKMRSEGGQGMDREARRAQMMEMREEHDAKIKEILGEEQFKQYQEIQEKRRSENQQGRRPEDGDSERPARGRGRN